LHTYLAAAAAKVSKKLLLARILLIVSFVFAVVVVSRSVQSIRLSAAYIGIVGRYFASLPNQFFSFAI
jgi:multidrug transporter EmrE-like cation transporter